MKVSVIGAGSWGTALSQVLANNGHNVGLWARKPEVVKAINSEHRNPRYLSDVELNPDIVATLSYRDTLLRARAAVIVTPSTLVRGAARALADVVDSDFPVIVCSKGIEEGSGLLPIDILDAEMGNRSRFAVLSGPNHAEEVVRGVPAATVIASESPDTAAFFQEMFACESFRAYTSEDACGVELCAAFKNVVAIAVGMSYGLGFGDNTAALLVSRGLAEMSRLVVACGGNAITCMGLAGTGDMVATCMSHHSRNRTFGDYGKGTLYANNLLFCALAGALWYSQFFGFGIGQTFFEPGSVVAAFAWCILMALNVTFSNVWGIILREWRGASRKTVGVLVCGLAILIFSLVFPNLF